MTLELYNEIESGVDKVIREFSKKHPSDGSVIDDADRIIIVEDMGIRPQEFLARMESALTRIIDDFGADRDVLKSSLLQAHKRESGSISQRELATKIYKGVVADLNANAAIDETTEFEVYELEFDAEAKVSQEDKAANSVLCYANQGKLRSDWSENKDIKISNLDQFLLESDNDLGTFLLNLSDTMDEMNVALPYPVKPPKDQDEISKLEHQINEGMPDSVRRAFQFRDTLIESITEDATVAELEAHVRDYTRSITGNDIVRRAMERTMDRLSQHEILAKWGEVELNHSGSIWDRPLAEFFEDYIEGDEARDIDDEFIDQMGFDAVKSREEASLRDEFEGHVAIFIEDTIKSIKRDFGVDFPDSFPVEIIQDFEPENQKQVPVARRINASLKQADPDLGRRASVAIAVLERLENVRMNSTDDIANALCEVMEVEAPDKAHDPAVDRDRSKDKGGEGIT